MEYIYIYILSIGIHTSSPIILFSKKYLVRCKQYDFMSKQ